MFIAFAKYSVMEGRGGRRQGWEGGEAEGGNILYIQSHALKQNMGGAPFLIDNKRSLSRDSNISQSFFKINIRLWWHIRVYV